uniref:alpha-glucosidase n=1 Tax=Bionectria ochroleuca TaxID=29856 RepID=A0A0B7JM87_BIOOC
MAPQRERIPANDDQGLDFTFQFEAVRPNIFRTSFTSSRYPTAPYPNIPIPSKDLSGAELTSTTNGSIKTIDAGDFEAKVDWETSSTPLVTISRKGSSGAPLRQDVPHRSYTVNGEGVAHYTRYNRNTLYVGLGEKAAPMNLAGRRFELNATDSFGYDSYRTDPLYKHIPLLINATPNGCVATFSTSHSRGMYSIGCEMDGMWGFYSVLRQDYGGLEEYTIVGKTLQDVVTSYAELAGFPLLVPRWAFGYLSGGYKYAQLDEPKASEALLEVARILKENDIPCSAHQLSSGYSISHEEPKVRHVFNWNRYRFPDPEAFLKEYRKQGIRIIANIKPYILSSHPDYQRLKEAGALFKDPHTGEAGATRLWSAGGGESDVGGHIDFTSEAGFKWWREGTTQLVKEGVCCLWNDNNEYTIVDDDWECRLDNPLIKVPESAKDRPQVGFWGRHINTELHGKASHDGMLAAKPNERPFVLTRAGTPGTFRYAASTWSGDNTINDNSVGDVIEPWMYPAITPHVRKAIKRRYAIMPYIYSAALQSHKSALPPQRWTGWGYESDPNVGGAIQVGRDVQVLSAGETENPAELPLDDYRGVEIFPAPAGSGSGKWFENTWYEDDGVCTAEAQKVSTYKISYAAADEEVKVKFERDESSGFVAPWKTLTVILPVGDERTVTSEGATVTDKGRDEVNRRRFELS